MTKKAEIKNWWKKLPGYIKGVAAIISAMGVIWGCLTGMVTFISEKLNENVNAQIQEVSQRVENIELDTQRLQLLHLMDSTTATKKSVIEVAERYFCELKGDSYMLYEFEEWGAKNDVDTSFILKCHSKTYANK